MLLISFSLFLLIPTSFSESLVWSDEFDTLNDEIWSHLVTTYPLVRTKRRKGVLLIKMYHVIVWTQEINFVFRMIFSIIVIIEPIVGFLMDTFIWCQHWQQLSMEKIFSTLESWTSPPKILIIRAIFGTIRNNYEIKVSFRNGHENGHFHKEPN